jgi:hypothetical protein
LQGRFWSGQPLAVAGLPGSDSVSKMLATSTGLA